MTSANTLWMAVLVVSALTVSAAPKMTVLRGEQAGGPNLLQNAGFEQEQDNRAAQWGFWQKGYRLAPGVGRQGSAAVTCQWQAEDEQYGASQTVMLNQQVPAPVIVRGWSKAQGVSGSPSRGYSLYCDCEYMDGTPLWGRTASFKTGTHDWQQVEVMILPAKPLKFVTLHCLFRGHRGRVWFDDVSMHELKAAAGTSVVNGVPVQVAPPAETGGEQLETGDGLTLRWRQQSSQVTGVAVKGRDLTAKGVPGGFMARDVAANSDFEGFEGGQCAALGLKLQAQWRAQKTHLVCEARLEDTSGRDRAITLLFALPVAMRGGQWGRNIHESAAIGDTGEHINPVSIGTGATGAMSLYPWSCVTDDRSGLALGLDLNAPAQYRLAYNAATQQYFIAYDFGLTKQTRNFPGAASFRFVIYSFDPSWQFRAATQKYYELFPDFFVCRSKHQGIWMPFTDVSTVQGWEDFGFRYHEGNNNVPWDDEHDILSFRYFEPGTWWMRMDKNVPREYDVAMAQLRKIAQEGKGGLKQRAQATLTSGIYNDEGRQELLFRDTPWCDGAVFSLSCLPGIPGEWTDAKLGWSPQLKEQLYGPKAQGQLDGEYLDSLEAYVTADKDFRPDHLAVVQYPLTFDRLLKRPVIYKAFAIYEYVKYISDDIHGMGKLMMANSVPHRFTFLCGYLDVMGTETNWYRNGQWMPMSHASMALKRTMCAQKPYLFLMNTEFEPFGGKLVEKYFQRSLFYGMYPSFFSPTASSYHAYWKSPEWYNRDRPLHKKYQPLCREVGEAGWQPITHARAKTDHILVERFGPGASGAVYVTVFNDGKKTAEAEIEIDLQALGIAGLAQAQELVSGKSMPLAAGTVKLTLQPEEVGVLKLAK